MKFSYLEHVAAAALALATSGCSLVYDGDVFARADAASQIDPTALALDSVEPAEVFEGLGASEGSREIPIVIHGSNIAPGARIQVSGAGIAIDALAQTSQDGTMAAAAIRVPVDTSLAAGSDLSVTVTIQQDQNISDTIAFDVVGLDEFSAVAGPLDTTGIAPRYSRVQIGEVVQLIGEKPARFVATDSITIAGELHADGRDDGQRSAGGFLGGLAEQDGGGTSGGGRGTNTAGGGGGGNLAEGGGGQGAGAGLGGAPTDAPFLFPLTTAVGHGGGGGGGAALGAAAGGAGGGAIELRADGPIALADGSVLSADGFDGGSTSNCGISGGGGAGGAGGAILVRSATRIDVDSNVSFSVAGGTGGSENALGSCKGGDGSPGRLRADYAEIDGSIGDAVRGPSWIVASVPAIVTTPEMDASIAGEVGATYAITINDGSPTEFTLTAATKEIPLALSPGLNRVCALVDVAGNQGQPESLTCLSIAYLP